MVESRIKLVDRCHGGFAPEGMVKGRIFADIHPTASLARRGLLAIVLWTFGHSQIRFP
jgi:hypothetical protein